MKFMNAGIIGCGFMGRDPLTFYPSVRRRFAARLRTLSAMSWRDCESIETEATNTAMRTRSPAANAGGMSRLGASYTHLHRPGKRRRGPSQRMVH